jgi:hypothetical protein
MTQTIDNAEAPGLIRLLAEKPCSGLKLGQISHAFCDCKDASGKVTGLANPWASEECPDCLSVEDGEAISEGCVTKGDARDGTLEIYGCTTCGGSGGGLETDSSLEGYPEGVASWNERMKRVGAKYGSGRVPKDVGLEDVMNVYPDDFWLFTVMDGLWRLTFRGKLFWSETPLLAALRAVVRATS